MKVIAAYLLSVLGGNTSPSADDLNKILGSVGAEADSGRIQFFLSEVKGKVLADLIASGKEKLAYLPCGGALADSASAAGGAAASPSLEEKKEDKVEEEDNSDDEMPALDLFNEDF